MISKISDLSIPGSGCGDVAMSFDGLTLSVRYEIRHEGKDQVGEMRFTGVRALRFRNEMLSGGFEPGSYDTLVVVPDSAWVAELEGVGPDGTRLASSKHYAVMLSSNGYIEVVADDVEIARPVEGEIES